MRAITTQQITDQVRQLCIDACCALPPDAMAALQRARQQETQPLGRALLGQLIENAQLAGRENLPICQDTGVAIVWVELGQQARLAGGDLESAIHEGVRRGYQDGYLRKSIRDPLTGKNTGDNTPAVIHLRLVPGDTLKITVAPKGAGSENKGQLKMLTPGDGALQSAVYAVLGRELALGFREVKSGGDGIKVTGFVSQPACCRASRNWQFFFVNGRQVKSRLLMAALEQAYQNQKMVGKFPACVLHVEVKLSQVDVNVHPAKTEVKFGSEREVFNAVYHAVLSVLEGDRSHPQATFSPARPKQTPGQTTMPGLSAQTYRQLTVADVATPRFTPKPRPTWTPPPAAAPRPSVPKKAPYVESGVENLVEKVDNSVHPVENLVDKVDKIPQETLLNSKKLEKHAQVIPSEPQPQPIPEPVAAPEPKDEPVEKPVQMPEPETGAEPVPEVEPWRLAGEVLNTYIIVEQGDKILLIDKHAAHERMNFDRMKAQGYQAMAQTLLSPVICRLAPEEQAVLLSNLPLLEEFGFQVDDFGGGALAVREAPDYLDVEDIPDTLSQLAQKLLTTGHADPAAARDELLHTMACKAAIKGGWKTSPQELERVAQAVMDGSVKYCPHGRPVAIELTRKELEKQFKRA